RSRIGEISPHLLDRFALRISDDAPLLTEQREQDVWRFASGGESVEPTELLSDELSERLVAASRLQPTLADGVASMVISIGSTNASQGVRRPIALARLSCGLARLSGASGVEIGHVQRAATLLEIAPGSKTPARPDEARPSELEAPALPAAA